MQSSSSSERMYETNRLFRRDQNVLPLFSSSDLVCAAAYCRGYLLRLLISTESLSLARDIVMSILVSCLPKLPSNDQYHTGTFQTYVVILRLDVGLCSHSSNPVSSSMVSEASSKFKIVTWKRILYSLCDFKKI